VTVGGRKTATVSLSPALRGAAPIPKKDRRCNATTERPWSPLHSYRVASSPPSPPVSPSPPPFAAHHRHRHRNRLLFVSTTQGLRRFVNEHVAIILRPLFFGFSVALSFLTSSTSSYTTLFLSPAMSLPSFVQLMASLGLQDTPALPRARHHRTASSSSSYSTSTSTAHAFSPWSSDPHVQTVVCPHPDASNPATADSQNSTTSTLSYSSQGSFRSSNAAPSPAIVVSAADPSPISHHHNWDTDRERERERALCNTKKATRYAPYKTESRDVRFPNHSIRFPCDAALTPIFLFLRVLRAEALSLKWPIFFVITTTTE